MADEPGKHRVVGRRGREPYEQAAASRRRRLAWPALVLVNAAIAAAVVLAVTQPEGGPGAAMEASAATPTANAFDESRAWSVLKRQVAYEARPAGSTAARRLARWARNRLPRGRFERVPGGLTNVVGTVSGRRPAVVVGAHYDTKALRGFVGANDGASGVAVVLELARVMRDRPRRANAPELRFVLFDGEESPDDAAPFEASGLRGSRAYAAHHRGEIRAVVILDMVGDRRLSVPREGGSDARIWQRLRRAAHAVGVQRHFPARTREAILDDHTPFARAGIPAIDVIDFDFECWHKRCDDLDAVSPRSLDVVGETVAELLSRWR